MTIDIQSKPGAEVDAFTENEVISIVSDAEYQMSYGMDIDEVAYYLGITGVGLRMLMDYQYRTIH